MRRAHRIRHAALRAVVAGLLAAGALSACGSGDGCGGFISINASPADCERRAEELGCEGFESDGPTCGLLGCVRCEDTE